MTINKVMLLPAIRKVVVRKLKILSAYFNKLAMRLEKLDLLSKKEKEIILRNLRFKNCHSGKRAFVIVNGPSLKKQDLSFLKNDITFAVSGFWKHSIVNTWQPTYYSILDKDFFKIDDNTTTFWNNLKSNISDSVFFLPLIRGYEWNLKNKMTPAEKTYYVASSGDPKAEVDLTKLLQSFQSVSALSLALAIYMGCSPIYLLGFDHDYLAHRGIDHHFYEGSVIPNHRNEKVPISEKSSYDEEMKSLTRLWENYRCLDVVAKKKGIKIYNATEGGYLDVFECIKYNAIFNNN